MDVFKFSFSAFPTEVEVLGGLDGDTEIHAALLERSRINHIQDRIWEFGFDIHDSPHLNIVHGAMVST